MWGWITFLVIFLMKVAGATPIPLRDATVTRAASFYLSTGFITRTTKATLNTVTFIAQTTVPTLDDQGKTITPSDAPTPTISAAAESVVGDRAPNSVPTPTPAPAPANDPTSVTSFVTLNLSTTYSTSHPSFLSSSSAFPRFQNIALDTPQDVGSVSATVSSSSQRALHATSQNAKNPAKKPKTNAVVIIGGTMIALSVTSILLFAVCLMWRRWNSERESRMRITPFPQSVSPSTPKDERPFTAAPPSPRVPTKLSSPLYSRRPYSHSQPPVSARSEKHLPLSPALILPMQSTMHTPIGPPYSHNDLMMSHDIIHRGPTTPPPVYTA